MSEARKYCPGYIFIRYVRDMEYLCVLLSRDKQKELGGKVAWRVAQFQISDGKDRGHLMGAHDTFMFDEDIESIEDGYPKIPSLLHLAMMEVIKRTIGHENS